MDFESTVQILSKRAASDEALHSVLMVLANRERTRDLLSLRTLHRDVRAAGYNHSIDECSNVLAMFSEIGIGKAKKGNKSRVVHLTGVTVDLKRLGVSVTNSSVKNTRKYKAASGHESLTRASKVVGLDPGSVRIYPMRQAATLSITLTINGKEMIVPIPENMTADEIQAIREAFSHIEFPKPKK
jgi:hypothetical protein